MSYRKPHYHHSLTEANQIDVSEDALYERRVLELLLRDQTMTWYTGQPRNIIWACDDYAREEPGFGFNDELTVEKVTGDNGQLIQPRVCKDRGTQLSRCRGKGEVFTPGWVCNLQNNLIDQAWFGRKVVFNSPTDNHTWARTTEPIVFPPKQFWCEYVRSPRLEITCGEAPYLVSRYDTATGELIPLDQRMGILDRKLRVVTEHCGDNPQKWRDYAHIALKSVYGYEWQGDSVLIARENLLMTFVDYYMATFDEEPQPKSLRHAAGIISWNIWQMDGLKNVPPGYDAPLDEDPSMFKEHTTPWCIIRDWSRDKRDQEEIFKEAPNHTRPCTSNRH